MPSIEGSFSITVGIKDSQSKSATKNLPLNIGTRVVINNSPLPTGIVGHLYNHTLQATGGNPPYGWTFIGGKLHAGLSLSPEGVISGTPTEPGGYSVGVRAQDSKLRAATSFPTLTISPVLEITTPSLADANVGTLYYQQIYTVGGVPPWEFNLAPGSGPLPQGLALANPGYPVIQGTPIVSGTYTFTLQLTDSGSIVQKASREFTLIVGNDFAISEYVSLPFGVIMQPYSESLVAYGGSLPYTWTIILGTIPPGLALNSSTGLVSGVPTESGHFELQVRVRDSATPPETRDQYVFLFIRPELAFRANKFPDGVRTIPYDFSIIVDGGRPPISMEYTSGALPPGISQTSQDPDFAIFNLGGTPTDLGTYPLSVRITDSSNPPRSLSHEFSIRINERLRFTTASLPEGITETPYSVTLTASGGVLPYRWGGLQQLNLPNGLTLDEEDGTISGIPTEPVNRFEWVNLIDSSSPPQSAFNNLWLRIVERLAITTNELPPTKPGQPVRLNLGLKGGVAPYSWANISGNFPSGLGFNSSSGQISGTPTIEGTSNFTVQVTDSGPPVQTATKALSMTIASDLGRNDSPATATPISNGTFRASISPYADPVAGPANPDHDYYQLTAAPGSIVTIETTARRLVPESFLDTVIEIVDADGNRFPTCRTPEFPGANYDQPCLNDDLETGFSQDSRLEIRIPGEETSPITIYVHVFSFNGSARPEYVYDLIVSGAN